ncbi:host specificity protein J [Xenorhabdus sp. XENO-10]|uniref:Host specificity protein J n=1 Tax=Xenorhabdus yunnanensis TaxID=3025878 RepID=A0ABT5LIV6_9GAMM|nr:host specificity protein J [Xenorhabdus yunnanensis]MDC9591057.1 host specificity protein J [Xenorhabdus yunnanensis]
MTVHIIEGAKGGGGGGHTPYEMPDNIQSTATAKVLVALGEGEFVNDLTAKDIYLDNTPLQNDNGTMNFEGIKWEFRPGTQHQNYIKGMPAAENEIRLGTEIKAAVPWTKYISNTKLSAVRVRLGWPALKMQKDNGDTVGYRIDFAIELSTDGGSYQTIFDTHIDAKTTTLYERSYRINLPDAKTGWTVRVVRKTANSTSERIIDKMNLMAFTEIIDAKLRYPNTALLYVEFDARLFNGNTPLISCKPKGRIIRVPSNYDPVNRTYSGLWNGTFKWAHSNNPAWVLYDLLLNDLCGLGDKIDKTQIDEAELYRVAQYCDQPVPDGKGGSGMEPRFTCDVYIQSREEAHKVLTDIGAIFRGSVYWGANQFVAMADMPDDIKYIFTQASVINGDFIYSGGSERNRSTVAMVSWSNPDNHYNDEVEVVSDDNLIRRYGINQIDIAAIGCTRQSEAQRRGKWAILTNSRDAMISFRVGLDGQIPLPGQIIGVAHKNRAGRVMGGRIQSVNDRNITLDRKPEAKAGDRLLVNLPSGVSQGRTIQAINSNIVTVTTPYSEAPRAESGWAVDANDLFIQQYRVVGIKDNNDGTFEINGIYHDPDKYARVDTGARIDERPISVIPASVQPPPSSVNITGFSFVQQGIFTTTVRISWEAAEGAIAYVGEWRRDSGNWISIPRSASLGFEIPNAYSGRYQTRIKAINSFDIPSLFVSSEEVNITGKQGNPPTPLGFKTTPIIFGIQLDWGFAPQTDDTLKTEIQYSHTHDGEGLMLLADIPYPQRTHTMQGLAAGVAFYFRARLVDKSGNQSPWTEFIRGESSTDTSWIVEATGNAFLTAEAGKRLQSDIDFANEAIMENAALTGAVVRRQLAENGNMRAEILEVKTTQISDRKVFAEKMEKIQADVGENAAAIEEKATAVFDIDGNGYAIKEIGSGVKYKNRFYKAGMVIGAEVKNGKVSTHVGFNAENFGWFNPASGKMEPFMMAKNGQLFIRDAFIDMANIQKLLVGIDIKSTNYIPNQRGFRIDAKTGHLEINGSGNGYRTQYRDTGMYLFDSNGIAIIEFGVFL